MEEKLQQQPEATAADSNSNNIYWMEKYISGSGASSIFESRKISEDDLKTIFSLSDPEVREKSRKSIISAEDAHGGSLDFNDYTTPGLYSVYGNGVYTNPPSYFVFVDGYLEVTYTETDDGSGGTSINIEQKYTHVGQAGTQGAYFKKSFLRISKNSAWYDWFSEPKNIAFAVRNTAGVWDKIEDVYHVPIGFSSLSQSDVIGSPNLTLNFQFFKVGSVVVAVDETYASYGLFVGSSVGNGPTSIFIYKQGMSINVDCDGTNFTASTPSANSIVKTTDFNFTFDGVSGELTIKHSELVFNIEDMVILNPTNVNYYPILVSQSNDECVVKFVDSTNTVVTSIDAGMSFKLNRTGVFQVPNSHLNISSSNIWVLGMNN